MCNNHTDIGYQIIGAAFEVRKRLGPHLYEHTYEQALKIELNLRGIECETQVPISVLYKDIELTNAFRIDLLVDGKIPVELKTLPYMGSYELSQILSYLTFGKFKLGYLINFRAKDFKVSTIPDDSKLEYGIYRVVK